MKSTLVQIRPKKLSPELRKPRPRYRDEKRWARRWMLRLREDPRAVRLAVQLGFVALCIWIGVEFHRFFAWGSPYGALLGLVGLLSPAKVTRDARRCITCQLCTRACPANIRVHDSGRVWSDECTSCMECVAVCPVTDALEIRARRRALSAPRIAAVVLGIFLGVTGLAMASGHWKNAISAAEYRYRFNRLDHPTYQHARGHVPAYSPND